MGWLLASASFAKDYGYLYCSGWLARFVLLDITIRAGREMRTYYGILAQSLRREETKTVSIVER